MKLARIFAALSLYPASFSVAFAADVPAAPPAPAVVDPVTAILVPIGGALNTVVQPVIVVPANTLTHVIAPPPPPAAPVVAKY